jgi:hypothetical protein
MGRFKPTFNQAMENELAQHLLEMNKRFFGLTRKECRMLAFEFAEKNELNHPFVNGIAGKDWFLSFLKRNPNLSLRTPEATSINRAIGFNRKATEIFFKLLSDVLKQYKIPPHRIFNADETGCQTVPGKLPKVIAQKGQKQVGKIVSAERGQTVTVVCTMGPTGTFLPPVFIFPRKRLNDQLKKDLPLGSLAVAHETGYMTKATFIFYLQHLVEYTHPALESPVLLIVDNHISHVSIEAISFCKENHIILLSIPPHTSHKLQPLDVGFYGIFKNRFNSECDKFAINNPGVAITQYHIGLLVRNVLLLTESTSTANSSFRKTGIYPYNPNVFHDDEYLPSEVYTLVDLDEEIEAPLSIKSKTSLISKETAYKVANIKPFPQARISRKRVHFSEILTDRPSVAMTAISTDHISMSTSTKQTRPRKLKKLNETELIHSTGAVENTCLYCCDTVMNSRPGEKWVSCSRCLRLAHCQCADVSPSLYNFICDLCK